MNTSDAMEKYADCPLRSELAQFCLPQAKRDPNRKLAWANSICILFLLIGIFGARSASLKLKDPPPIEQIVPAIVEPPPPSPTRIEAQQNPEPKEEAAPQAQPVVVTIESPAINFSVPTIGTLVVPNAIATVPPANPLAPVTPAQNGPITITDSGRGGERPAPPYPEMAKELRQQGTVVLLAQVDERGLITSVKVDQTSGHPILDRSTLEYVKRHWILPSGSAGGLYLIPVHYQLE